MGTVSGHKVVEVMSGSGVRHTPSHHHHALINSDVAQITNDSSANTVVTRYIIL
jgi:hypothetical protein